MKKIWFDSANEIGFDSLETAIKSAESYLGQKYNTQTMKVANYEYVISCTSKNDSQYIENFYIFEIPICETVEEYKQEMKKHEI